MSEIPTEGGGPTGFPPETSAETSQPESSNHGKARWLVLVAVVLGLFMAVLDNLVVNGALPTMQRELDAGASDLPWITNAYTLTFVSFLLIGGSIGDLFGRKKCFVGGLVLFILGSVACGVSGSTEEIIPSRALQGIGAGLLLPGSLSILTATFHARRRGTAIGIWAAMLGLAVAMSPLIGAYIIEDHSWEMIFFINIPVGVVALLLTTFVVKESRDTTRLRKIDFPGLITGTAGLFFLVYALIEGEANGWTDELILGAFTAAALLLLAFMVIEVKRKNPLVPLHFFRNPTFAASNVVAASLFFALFGTTYFLAVYLQDVRGFPPLETGVRLIPFAAAILIISPIAGKLTDKHGCRWLINLGCLYAAGGMALLLRIDPTSSYENVILPALVVLGAGVALTMAPMTAAVMGSVDARHAGIASTVGNTTRELGGVLGIALLGALVTSSFKDRLLDNLTSAGLGNQTARSIADRASGSAAFGGESLEAFRRQVPPGTPDTVVAQVVTAAQDSFLEAIHSGLLVAVGFMVLAALVAAVFVRSHVKLEEVEPVPADDEDKVRKPEMEAEPAPGGAVIDPRTEQVLRDALEPSTVTSVEPEPDLQPEPAEPLATTNWASEPLKPARRDRAAKRSSSAISPVSVSDTHYHEQPAQPVAANGWTPESEVEGAVIGNDSYHQLRTLMVDLPVKAGTGSVEENLYEVALATLNYYLYGLSQPGGDTLPVGITNGAQSSTREDIVILAGYLDLEKRFGRVEETLDSEQAAAHLMAALASRALDMSAGESAGNEQFVRKTVGACLQGVDSRPAPAGSESSAKPAEGPPRPVHPGGGADAGPEA